MAAFAVIVGGLAGVVIGGYSGYVQGVAAYGLEGMEDNSATISGVLWAIVGAIAGTAPGFYKMKQYAAAGFGTGALQGAVDSALGHKHLIESAIEGLAMAVIGAGTGGILQLFNRSGAICKVIRIPYLAPIAGSVLAGLGIGSASYGIYQSYRDGNDLPMVFRCIFSIVDLIAIPKAAVTCFTEETLVGLPSDAEYVEQTTVTQEVSFIDTDTTSDTFSYMSYVIVGLIATIFCGVQIVKNSKSSAKEEMK
ncbi:MAG: hypothetical protein LBC02_11545 [Planctomycetaceae bacterium]|jgi:hypothetical protein|nr:hypothetical protein [Planctomycetaceae bacterium]